MQSSKTALMLP